MFREQLACFRKVLSPCILYRFKSCIVAVEQFSQIWSFSFMLL